MGVRVCNRCGAFDIDDNHAHTCWPAWPGDLDRQEFYDLMQAYRMAPITDQKLVSMRFDEVRFWIRDNIYSPLRKRLDSQHKSKESPGGGSLDSKSGRESSTLSDSAKSGGEK